MCAVWVCVCLRECSIESRINNESDCRLMPKAHKSQTPSQPSAIERRPRGSLFSSRIYFIQIIRTITYLCPVAALGTFCLLTRTDSFGWRSLALATALGPNHSRNAGSPPSTFRSGRKVKMEPVDKRNKKATVDIVSAGAHRLPKTQSRTPTRPHTRTLAATYASLAHFPKLLLRAHFLHLGSLPFSERFFTDAAPRGSKGWERGPRGRAHRSKRNSCMHITILISMNSERRRRAEAGEPLRCRMLSQLRPR